MINSSPQPTPPAQPVDTQTEDKHTYVDQLRVRYGFGVILCAFLLVGITVGISVYFFFTANEAVAIIGTVTGMVVAIISTWFGISSANAVANRALSGQAQSGSVVSGAAPTITSILPSSGPSGTEVTITGKGFTGATAVTFGGIVSIDVKVVSDVTITADVPEGKCSAPYVDVTVVRASGTLSAANQGAKFSFKGTGVGRLLPSHDKPKAVISLLGSGFSAGVGYSVQFGTSAATGPDVTFVDETKLHVVVPDVAAGTTPPLAVIVTIADATAPAKALSAPHAQAVFIYD